MVLISNTCSYSAQTAVPVAGVLATGLSSPQDASRATRYLPVYAAAVFQHFVLAPDTSPHPRFEQASDFFGSLRHTRIWDAFCLTEA